MFRKWKLMSLIFVMLISAGAMVISTTMSGCSQEKAVNQPVDQLGDQQFKTDAATEGEFLDLSQENEFLKDLQDGKYSFAVDEETYKLEPLDGETIPEEEKELYAKFVEEPNKVPPGLATSHLSNYWRYACWREICYALSAYKYVRGQYGQSRRSYYWNRSWWLAGDWNYDGLGYGKGGECKYFGSRIVTRATGGRYSLPGGSNYAHGDIGWCRPGDIIQRPGSNKHTAIVFTVLSRDGSGKATRIDVIDSNYIGGRGRQMIARHYFPYGSWRLSYFRVW